jgi:hypothetical protein
MNFIYDFSGSHFHVSISLSIYTELLTYPNPSLNGGAWIGIHPWTVLGFPYWISSRYLLPPFARLRVIAFFPFVREAVFIIHPIRLIYIHPWIVLGFLRVIAFSRSFAEAVFSC